MSEEKQEHVMWFPLNVANRLIGRVQPHWPRKRLVRACRLLAADMMLGVPSMSADGEVPMCMMYSACQREALETLRRLADNPTQEYLGKLKHARSRVYLETGPVDPEHMPPARWPREEGHGPNGLTPRWRCRFFTASICQVLSRGGVRSLQQACMSAHTVALSSWRDFDYDVKMRRARYDGPPRSLMDMSATIRDWQRLAIRDVLGGPLKALRSFPARAREMALACREGQPGARQVLSDWCEEEGFQTMARHLRLSFHCRACWAVEMILGGEVRP